MEIWCTSLSKFLVGKLKKCKIRAKSIRDRGTGFISCSECTLNSDTLKLTCKCATVAQGFRMSTIDLGRYEIFNAFAHPRKLTENIDGTAKVDGNGVFVRDNGRLSCRAPISG
jgi:hypothetical protein